MIHLFKNYYTDRNPVRNRELIEVRKRDAENTLLTVHAIEGRPTFADIFRAMNEVLGCPPLNHVGIVANADVAFDETIGMTKDMGLDESYALTRWDDLPTGLKLFAEKGIPRIDSQDCWIFRGPIRQELIDAANFKMGVRGSDNALLAMIADAGYRVSNPSKTIKAIHLHRSGVRRHSRSEVVPKPYLCIPPHALGEEPELRWNRPEMAVAR